MVCWQCYKDPMHAYDHGVAMHMIHAIVKTIHKLEVDLLNRLTVRMHNLCSSLDTKHTTLMGFTNQSIVTVFETLTTPGKKGQKQSPIVDAGDVQKLMLTLPYLLDGLADEELEAHVLWPPALQIPSPRPAWPSTSGCTGTSCFANRSLLMMMLIGSLTWERPFSARSSACFRSRSRLEESLGDLCGATKRCTRSCMPPGPLSGWDEARTFHARCLYVYVCVCICVYLYVSFVCVCMCMYVCV